MTAESPPITKAETIDGVVIRFAGDSGDGMQLTGDRFTDVSAAFGNDLATLPNFPAEIRAPAGTIAGVSSLGGSSTSRSPNSPAASVVPIAVRRKRSIGAGSARPTISGSSSV